MATVLLSPKFQVVIPQEVREAQNLAVGMRLEVIAYHNRIELIPLRPLKELRGLLKGIDTTIKREKDRL